MHLIIFGGLKLDNPIFKQLIFQFILIFLNAVFASAEIAVISMNNAKLEKLASDGNKKAVRLSKLVSQPARFLATIQVAITLSGFLGSAFAADNFSDYIVELLKKMSVPLPENVLDTISVVFITLILSYFTLIFGELVPKRIAMKNSEKLALGLSAPISFIAIIFAPIVWVLTISTNALLSLMGIDPNNSDDEVTEEEIRMMVDAGSEKGTIDKEEKELIQNVFGFDDISIDQIATHRTNVCMLWLDESLEEWEKIINQTKYSYYPVCSENVDNIIGILDARDYFRLKEKTRENILKDAVTQPYLVPENLKADILFKNMKLSNNYFAVVIDEYGGMTGIITMKDLVQQIVGEFDSFEEDDNDIVSLGDKTWKIRGNSNLDEVEQALGVTFDYDDDDIETFGGFVFYKYGSIPEDGSTFEFFFDRIHIKVLEIKDHCISAAIVKILPEAAQSSESTSAADNKSADKDK